MTKHAGHGHGAVSPGTAEVEVKFIVLDILIASNCMLCLVLVAVRHDIHNILTV